MHKCQSITVYRNARALPFTEMLISVNLKAEIRRDKKYMMTREEALAYGMSFYNVYEEKPFRDPNWQLVRIKGSKKTFLWIYEREGYINLNVKVNPEWRDFWRSAYESVTAGYHLNKEFWMGPFRKKRSKE